MDLTIIGACIILGHLLVRGLLRKEDHYKVNDIVITCIGLLLIIGSRYLLFGG